jgi:hypothetical protein
MRGGSLDFYSTGAQVIAVLFVVIAFELRFFGDLDREPERDMLVALVRVYAFGLVAWGEWRALHALSIGYGDKTTHGAVVAALVAEFAVLALVPLGAFSRSAHEAIPERIQPAASLARRALLVLAGVLLLVLGMVQILRSL